MELIAAIIAAGPLGYFVQSLNKARLTYLGLWAVIFPIQTIVVHSENPDDIVPLYFALNIVILGLGLGLNYAGARLRERRAEAVS